MHPFILVKTVLLSVLLLTPLAAEDVDPAQKCEEQYDACYAHCDEADNPSEKCYEACSETYDACLAAVSEEQ